MPPTKDKIIERLTELQIQHDPKANKDELLALLPDDDKPPIDEVPAGRVVQLTRNAKDRQVGETFPAAEAARLGILEYCRPFTG